MPRYAGYKHYPKVEAKGMLEILAELAVESKDWNTAAKYYLEAAKDSSRNTANSAKEIRRLYDLHSKYAGYAYAESLP